MTTHDPAYFAGRALEEYDAARRAACAEAKICHEKLAEAYRQRCMETLPAGTKGHMVKAKAINRRGASRLSAAICRR